MDKTHADELAEFIREHRSSEGNFDKLYAKLNEEANSNNNDGEYSTSLSEIQDNLLPAYQAAKETGGTAWPEFEKFVTAFEKAVTAVKREQQ